MKIWKSLCLCLAVTALLGFNTVQAAEKNVITVTGTAFAIVKPDMATVNMRIAAKGKTTEGVREALAVDIAKVQQALAFAGVTEDKIKTGQYNIVNDIIHRKNGQSQTIGYKGNCSFTAQVEQIDKIGTVVDRIGNLTNIQITGVTFGLLHREAMEQNLLTAATENAKEKATLVANAGGRTLGSLLSADLGSEGGTPVLMAYEANGDLHRSAKFTSTQLAPGTIKLSARVSTQWSLL